MAKGLVFNLPEVENPDPDRGICRACGALTDEALEDPDLRGYVCGDCGKPEVCTIRIAIKERWAKA